MKMKEEKESLLPADNPLIGAIRRRMKELNVNQKKAASMLGLSESRISDLLNGRRKINLNIAVKLRNNFGISADFILDNFDALP